MRLTLGCAALVGVLITSGCTLPIPTRPVRHEPISLTVVDDRISWVQCLDEDIRLYSVRARVKELSGDERDWPVYVAGGGPEDAVSVAPGVPVDLGSDFDALEVYDSVDLPVSSLSGRISVFIRLSGIDFEAVMGFRDIDADSLKEGAYVYYSGEVSDEPCGMERE